MAYDFPVLSFEQEDDIRRFAAENGRGWKDRLCERSWWPSRPLPRFPTLYGLRNSHGGEWLDRYHIPATGGS